MARNETSDGCRVIITLKTEDSDQNVPALAVLGHRENRRQKLGKGESDRLVSLINAFAPHLRKRFARQTLFR